MNSITQLLHRHAALAQPIGALFLVEVRRFFVGGASAASVEALSLRLGAIASVMDKLNWCNTVLVVIGGQAARRSRVEVIPSARDRVGGGTGHVWTSSSDHHVVALAVSE